MRIGLIYPSRNRKKTYSSAISGLNQFFETNEYLPSFSLPSLSLLTIAGCTPNDVEVKLIDERVSQVNYDQGFDLVGISIMTEQALRGYEIAQEFRKRGVFTVLGGIHASTLPEEAGKHADCVVVGEGEITWPQLLEDFKNGVTKKIYFSKQQIDLEQSPIPRYSLADVKAFPFLPTQTTRGCPLDCSFCTVTKVYGAGYRTKTVKRVLREVEAILQVSRNRKLAFNDDNMFVSRKNSYELLEALIPLRIRYFTESDVSITEDERLLSLLQKSGCVSVFIGFESLVPENLASFQRNQWKLKRLRTYSEACQRIQSHGIQVLGAFIVGFDHDDNDSIRRLIDFTLANNILGQYHLITPFPGTRIREDLIREKRLAPNDARWDIYSCFDVVFTPKKISKEQLEAGLLEIYQTVYSRRSHLKRFNHMLRNFKGKNP
jgi:radical SAM superfamily enzyme YgiQ (UPF0313 family)